jgi:Flp pilus assembly protein TadD
VSSAIATEPAKPSEPAPKSRKRKESAQANPIAGDSAKPPARQPKAAAAGNCDLDTKLLPKMLDQAERNRQQGNYPAALRQFRAVLACDRNNARARRGLDLTGLAMQHQ